MCSIQASFFIRLDLDVVPALSDDLFGNILLPIGGLRDRLFLPSGINLVPGLRGFALERRRTGGRIGGTGRVILPLGGDHLLIRGLLGDGRDVEPFVLDLTLDNLLLDVTFRLQARRRRPLRC